MRELHLLTYFRCARHCYANPFYDALVHHSALKQGFLDVVKAQGKSFYGCLRKTQLVGRARFSHHLQKDRWLADLRAGYTTGKIANE